VTARRACGVALVALAFAPFHRLLGDAATGLAGTATRALTEGLWQAALWGMLVSAVATAVLTRYVPVDPWRLLAPLGRRLAGVPPTTWAAAVGAIGFLLTATATWKLFAGLPTSVDAMVELAHARALSAGRMTLPLHGEGAAWMIQNSFATSGGLASVYPPGHTLAMAMALRLGMGWMLGPVAVGVLAAFSYLAFARMAPESGTATRLAGVSVALSPFVWLLGASQLSHASAGAAAAVLGWTVLKARDGSPTWAVFSGVAAGVLVCTRPLTGLVLGAAMPAAAWLAGAKASTRPRAWLTSRALRFGLGGLPLAALLFGWNSVLNGGPLRLGYAAAFGPGHGLGFHVDPWGNQYGPVQALAYSGADMVGLGASLFGSPLPAVAIVAVGLLLVPAGRGRALLWAWSLVPVAANALYWHHGQHLGPRMLYEAAPAWVALVVFTLADASRSGARARGILSRASGWLVAVSLLGALLTLPSGIRALRTPAAVVYASTLPPPGDQPGLIFVHGSWSTRIAARLAAAGMRRDSIETALRRNATCAVDRYTRWRTASGAGPRPEIDFERRAGKPAGLESWLVSPGNRILVAAADTLDGICQREASSDRLGTVELEPLLWQAPPLEGRALIVARDLGPFANARVLARLGRPRAWVAVDGGEGSPIRLVEYADGMELLWRGAASVSGAGG